MNWKKPGFTLLGAFSVVLTMLLSFILVFMPGNLFEEVDQLIEEVSWTFDFPEGFKSEKIENIELSF